VRSLRLGCFGWLLVQFIIFAGVAAAADPYALRPPDTSSPRATLQGFIGALDETYVRFAVLISKYAASNRLYLSAEEWRSQREALASGLKAVQFMDLSQVSPVLHDIVAPDRAIQLKEIFDRIEMPPFEEIPDRAGMEQSSAKRWRLPNTGIEIALIESGPRAGEYLISAATIDRVPEFYGQVRELPYKPGPAKQLDEAYRLLSGNRTFTIHDAYATSPVGVSMIVPPRWMLNLPGWAKARIAQLAVWQWLAFAFGLGICVLVAYALYRLARWLARRGEVEEDIGLHSLLTPLAIVVVMAFLIPLLAAVLRIGDTPRIGAELVRTVVLYLAAAWLVLVGAGVLGNALVASGQLSVRSLDSQLIKLGTRFVGIVIAIGLLMQGATELGFPAYSVIAGLGVGGLAVALAARDSLANLLGSVLIMFEKPFRVGHRIRVSGNEGTVEDVGFRSTWIRTLDNSLLSIPNNAVVNATVENLTLRKMFRERLVLQVTYDTPRERLETFARRLQQLIEEHPTTDKTTIRVRFNDFGESSLNILVIFHLVVADGAAELEERETLLLQFIDLAQELGVQFAFPTRTLHVEATPSPGDRIDAGAKDGASGAARRGPIGLVE
jgi:MscS family membrane protein